MKKWYYVVNLLKAAALFETYELEATTEEAAFREAMCIFEKWSRYDQRRCDAFYIGFAEPDIDDDGDDLGANLETMTNITDIKAAYAKKEAEKWEDGEEQFE